MDKRQSVSESDQRIYLLIYTKWVCQCVFVNRAKWRLGVRLLKTGWVFG